MKAVDDTKATLLIIADHGNCEEMLDDKNNEKTSHTINPVPFIVYGKQSKSIKMKNGDFGLANLASSICVLFDIPKNDNWLESIIEKIG